MTSTDSSAPAALTPTILDLVAATFIWEYEAVFKIAYERAVKALGKSAQGRPRRPREPGDEIRNAFDHFALATRFAFVVDGRKVPPPAHKISGAPEKPNPRAPTDPRDIAYNNLDQARRHLAVGRFYCIEHQILCVIKKLRPLIADLDDTRRHSYIERANLLSDKFADTPRLFAGAEFDLKLIDADIKEYNSESEKLTEILNGFLLIARELAPAAA
jgi:hypothetical protein